MMRKSARMAPSRLRRPCSYNSIVRAGIPNRRSNSLVEEATFKRIAPYLSRRCSVGRQFMRLQLDFAAQVSCHLLEGLDKIIADA